jgi:6-phosphofructokinase 1
MPEREIGVFDDTLTTERALLRQYLKDARTPNTEIRLLGERRRKNHVSEAELGAYRPVVARKTATADFDIIKAFLDASLDVPTFYEAGPREMLFFDPRRVKAAIVTTGGLAPGLNSIVHSIVKRHFHTYELNEGLGGAVFGVYDSFLGLQRRPIVMTALHPEETEEWLEKGGSELGNRRTKKEADIRSFADDLLRNLESNQIDILYVIGGEGSQTLAHSIAELAQSLAVVGLPKTMDNDLLWVWQSFGFNTAVERAVEVINILNCEARSTRRVCLVELFGAESGFVAANAALASGHADLVLVPEIFSSLSRDECNRALSGYLLHLERVVKRDRERPHGVAVIAEGVGKLLATKSTALAGVPVSGDFIDQLKKHLGSMLKDTSGQPVEVFVNKPLHSIRAGRANAHDQIYCERLGALAVDNALAGFTDCMISQWLTEYVLVPLSLVANRRKRIPPEGIFWKQVCSSTGQPPRPWRTDGD